MNDYFVIIPFYNDSKSLNKLLYHINKDNFFFKKKINVVIINDASTENLHINNRLKNLNKIFVINLKKNIGSQRAIFICLKYLEKLKKRFIISIIDADGEDNPKKLKALINIAIKKDDTIVVANRSKRTENILLQLINKIRLLITYFLTGYYINFGNFSSFSNINLKKILNNNNLWFAYSGGILKNAKKIIYVNINKKKRYYGNSKVNFQFLLLHAVKIISIFKNEILFRSSILFLIIFFLIKNTKIILLIFILILFFNTFNFLFFKFNNLNYNSLKLIRNIKTINNNY